MTPGAQRPKDSQRLDPARSSCVLIGVDAYTELESLRAVRNNLTELREVLTDPAIWGIDPRRVRVATNPESQAELVDPIAEMAEQAEDTLIIYYSGHGLIDPDDDQLYLTLTGSTPGAPHTAVPFEWVRRAMRHHGSAKRRVVILDCCYSGRALERMSAPELGIQVAASIEDVRGSYLMTSTAQNQRALAPRHEHCTLFTGRFVEVLREGIPDMPEMLGLNDIFKQVRERLLAHDWPRPEEQDQNGIGELPFVHNTALSKLPRSERQSKRSGWSERQWAILTTAVVLAFVVGLMARPVFDHERQRHFPHKPGGPCSSRATLLSYSDKLDMEEVHDEKITGLSAMALTDRSHVLTLTDDNSHPARVFPVALGSPQRLRPRPTTAITLENAHGIPYSNGFDGEGLVLEKGAKTMLVSSEVGPSIHRFRTDTGREQGKPLPIPKRLRTEPTGQAQNGRTIEALAATPDGRYVYAGMESPLSVDGDERGQNLLRIQRYKGKPGGRYEPDRQYAYRTGAGLHLVDMATVGDDRLVTLERQYVDGLGNASRAYDVSLKNAPDVTSYRSLYEKPASLFVHSKLLFDLAKCPAGSPGQVRVKQHQPNRLLDNVEGMALGKSWKTGKHKGWRPLYLVSDDNDNSKQTTRLYALRVRIT